jgi:hypothetical protein
MLAGHQNCITGQREITNRRPNKPAGRRNFNADQLEIVNHHRNMLTGQRDCITGQQKIANRHPNLPAGQQDCITDLQTTVHPIINLPEEIHMSEPTPTPATPKRSRGNQDQRIADRIAAAHQTLLLVQSDSELAALLAGRGYDAARLAEGQALQVAAQAAFTGRQRAAADQTAATAARVAADATARRAYNDFRATARAIFPEPAASQALGLAGAASDDLQKFLTAARTSYDVALNTAAYLTELARFGYPQATLQAACGLLDDLAAADAAQEAAKAAAMQATRQRDAAAAALDAWLRRFRTVAKIATRGRPDLGLKLGL